jgi:ankyrin repeat protein
VIKFLLDKGADVRAKDKDGVTALHMAAVRGWRLEMTRLMVEKGADVNAKTTTGETPLFWASQTNSVGAVKYLFDKGATVDLDAKEFAGLPILIWAAMNHPPSLKALLDKGADVEVKDGAGRTPLMMAAKAGQIEAVRLLLEKGASVTAKAANGDTALKLAGNKKEIADLLRQKGATE